MKHIIALFLFLVINVAIARPKVEYKSYNTLYKEKLQECKLNMLDSAQTVLQLSKLPQGGSLFITVTGSSIESGNPKKMNYIIEIDVDNVIRQTGSNIIPSPSVVQGTTWWIAGDILHVKSVVGNGFKFYIVDSIYNKRYAYYVDVINETVTKAKE